MTDEKICIDKDGNEVPCGTPKAVRQLTHDDAKAFRKNQNKAAAKSENKDAGASDDKEAEAVVASTDADADVIAAGEAETTGKPKRSARADGR